MERIYVGGHVGGKWGDARAEGASGGFAGVPITPRYDVAGWLAGGTFGCNYQARNWVFGLEGDISWTNAGGESLELAPFNTNFVTRSEEQWIGTARARLGYAVDRTLFYVTGGGAWARVDISTFDSTNPTIRADESFTRSGWTVGGGIEHALTPNWTIKAEYLYLDFGTIEYNNPNPIITVIRHLELAQHIARVGVNYKF